MERDINNTDKHSVISWQNENRRGKVAAGFFLILYGLLFLLRELDFNIPHWLFTWPMILIVIGTVTLIKHKFRKLWGYTLILVGKLFLLREFYPDLLNFRLLWPVFIIFFGIMIMFKPGRCKRKARDKHRDRAFRKEFHKAHFAHSGEYSSVSEDDFIDTTSFFGGIKKNVVSKNFIGADIVTFFGGSEINLAQADIQEDAIIDTTNIFGGLKLIIPRNWKIQSELTTMFGSIEDNRIITENDDAADEKVLILRGTCIFGGIEIVAA